jgi:hypothetical protein
MRYRQNFIDAGKQPFSKFGADAGYWMLDNGSTPILFQASSIAHRGSSIVYLIESWIKKLTALQGPEISEIA